MWFNYSSDLKKKEKKLPWTDWLQFSEHTSQKDNEDTYAKQQYWRQHWTCPNAIM